MVTISPDEQYTITRDFKQAFGYLLIPLGKIIKERGIVLTQQGVPKPFSYATFSHFGEK